MLDEDRCKRIISILKDQSSSVSFLSEIVLDSDDLEYLKDNFAQIVYKSFDREEYCALTAYVLVFIGIESYNATYWPHVDELMGHINNTQKDRENILDSFLTGLKYLNMSNVTIETKRNIEQILIHTLVPNKAEYLDNFFTFVYNYYDKIMNYEIPDVESGDFEKLSEYVRNTMKYKKSETGLDFKDYPNPSSLPMCTRYALTEPKLYEKLLMKIIKIIHSGCNGHDYRGLGNNRFTQSFQRWYMENIGHRSKRERREMMRMHKAKLILSSDYRPAIEIPVMRCTPGAKIQFIIKGRAIEPSPQPTIIKLPGNIYSMIHSPKKYFLDSDQIKISPFDCFTVKFDNKNIFNNKEDREWIAFDKDMIKTSHPTVGWNYFLFKDKSYDPRTNNTIRFSKGEVYYTNLCEGDILNICNDTLQIIDDNDECCENQITIKQLENIDCVDYNGIKYGVCNSFAIKCQLSNIRNDSLIMVKISIDDGVPIHRKIDTAMVLSCNNTFLLSGEGFPINEIHKFEIELDLDREKIDSVSFLLLPEYSHHFDTDGLCYYTKTEGTLNITGPFTKEFHFKTSDDTFQYPIDVSGNSWQIIHIVPSLFLSIDNGESWRGPSNYNVCLDDLLFDSLFVRCLFDFKIYSSKPMEMYRDDDHFVVSIAALKNEMKDRLDECYSLSISVNHTQKFSFMNIITHNEYEFKEKDGNIIVWKNALTDNQSFCDIEMIDGRKDHITLLRGDNVICPIQTDRIVVSVVETDIRNNNFVIKKKEYGKTIFYTPTKTGCRIVHNGNSIELNCDIYNIESIKMDYDGKLRFNPWMKKPGVKNDIMKLFDNQHRSK